MRSVLIVVAAYLLGSIPFGYLIVRARAGVDIRETGSGGTGATNVSRRAGKVAGALTLVLDALKGALAVWLARTTLDGGDSIDWSVALAAIAVLIGHIYPIWLRFRGGKGVATGVGVFLSIVPISVACAAVVFLSIVAFTRYVSLGSITAAAAIPLFVWLQHVFIGPIVGLTEVMFASVVSALLIIFAHRTNIVRLVQGRENKLS
jgi:glycerol-3-phosphate acyltransferase PlsY